MRKKHWIDQKYKIGIISSMLLMCLELLGQSNILILGTIDNPTTSYIKLTINKTELSNTIVETFSSLNAEGKFGLAARLEVPMFFSA